MGAGVVARRRYGQLDAALAAVGAGLAGWYVTLLAATARYDLVDQAAARPRSRDRRGRDRARAGMVGADPGRDRLVGAALAPAAVAIDTGIEVLGSAFAALVFAAIAVVGLRRSWTWLLVAGVAATAPQWAALLVVERDEPAGGAVAVAVLLVALYLATGVARALAANRLDALSSVLVPLSASLGVASIAALLDDRGVWLLVLALPYAALAATLFGRARDLSALLAAAAMVVSALGFADLLGGLGLTVAWALQASALAWLAGRSVSRGSRPRRSRTSVSRSATPSRSRLRRRSLQQPAAIRLPGSRRCSWSPARRRSSRGGRVGGRLAEGGGELARLFADLVGVRSWWAGGATAVAALAVVDAASAATLALVENAGVEPAFDWGRVAVAALWSALGAALYAGGTWLGRRAIAVAGAVWLAVTGIDVIAFDLNELGGRRRAGLPQPSPPACSRAATAPSSRRCVGGRWRRSTRSSPSSPRPASRRSRSAGSSRAIAPTVSRRSRSRRSTPSSPAACSGARVAATRARASGPSRASPPSSRSCCSSTGRPSWPPPRRSRSRSAR